MAAGNSKIDCVTLTENKGRHYLFPAIARLSQDRYVLMFHDAPARKPPVQHDPKSMLSIVTGTKPWEPDMKRKRPVPRFPCSGYAPTISRLSEDRLVIIDNSWHIYNWMGEPLVRTIKQHDWVLMLRGAHTIIVDDSSDKLRFGKPRRIFGTEYPIVFCYDSPVIENETILCAVDYNTDCSRMEDNPWETLLMASKDPGHNWEPRGRIYFEEDFEDLPRLNCPSIVQLDDSRLICALSDFVSKPEIFFSNSDDTGRTWSKPEAAGITGRSHSLIRLSDGRLLLVVNPVDAPQSIVARISEDDGRTWPENLSLKIDDRSISAACGHPRGLQMDDGSVFFVYHSHLKKGTRSIVGAHFEI